MQFFKVNFSEKSISLVFNHEFILDSKCFHLILTQLKWTVDQDSDNIIYFIFKLILLSQNIIMTTGAWGMDFVSSSPLFSTTPPFFLFHIHSFFKIFIIIRFSSFDNISRRHTSRIIRVFCVQDFFGQSGCS